MNEFLMTTQSACDCISKSEESLGSCSVLNAAGTEALFHQGDQVMQLLCIK